MKYIGCTFWILQWRNVFIAWSDSKWSKTHKKWELGFLAEPKVLSFVDFTVVLAIYVIKVSLAQMHGCKENWTLLQYNFPQENPPCLSIKKFIKKIYFIILVCFGALMHTFKLLGAMQYTKRKISYIFALFSSSCFVSSYQLEQYYSSRRQKIIADVCWLYFRVHQFIFFVS